MSFTEWRALIAASHIPSFSCYAPEVAITSERRRMRKERVVVPNGLRTMHEAAARLGCSEKTLKGHLARGEIGYIAIGHGLKRPRRMFADTDIDAFIANQSRKDAPCPSTGARAHHIGNSTSSGEVIDFTAPRRPRPDVKPRK
jgi:hypothetical protein